ncbi:uncharacterized protein LOC121424124 [Lytechinus variegatus]|uniref:uncharacterized protein LOC121424124 n=1 Tax=Lytechinus variegatus TaxID=7654 RepID=UPI001BB16458|nr:uncharacterized protein LOC121424124 [Lytechinus variegatus]
METSQSPPKHCRTYSQEDLKKAVKKYLLSMETSQLPPKRCRTYSQEDLKKAVKKVKKKKMPLAAAARKYNIPERTLRDKVFGRYFKKDMKKDTNKDTPSPSTNQYVKEEGDEKPQRVKKRSVGYTQEDVEEAVRLVKKGEVTLGAAAKEFDIPRTTLHNKVFGRTAVMCSTGRASFLTAAEEAQLSNWALEMSDKDMPSPSPINRSDKEENPIAVDEIRVKTRRVRYSQEDMELAIRTVKEKEMTLRAAAKKFNVPRSTLHDKVLGRTPVQCNTGRAPFLTAAEETLLSNWVLQTSRIGQCPSEKDIIQVVKEIIDDDGRETPFKNNQPDEKLFNLFLKRHPELAPGTPILKSKVPNPNFVSPALHEHLTVPLASDSPRIKRENIDETDEFSNGVRLKTRRVKKSKQTGEEKRRKKKRKIITIVIKGNKKPGVVS